MFGVEEIYFGNFPYIGVNYSGDSMSVNSIFCESFPFVTSKDGSPVASMVDFSNIERLAKEPFMYYYNFYLEGTADYFGKSVCL